MFWIPLATMVAGAAMGKAKSDAEEARMRKQTKLRAAEQKYAPWTGRESFTQIQEPTSQVGNILGGAVSGFSTGQSISGSDTFKDMFGGGSMSPPSGPMQMPSGPTLGANVDLQGAGVGSSLQDISFSQAPGSAPSWQDLLKKQQGLQPPTLMSRSGSMYGSMLGSV